MTRKINGANETERFLEVYETLRKDILSELPKYNMPVDGAKHVEHVLDYNIRGGKMNRGIMVLTALEALKPGKLSADEIFKAQTLGWCIEFLQAFFLIADDIMDGSITRRGQPCWYKVENVGLMAINDGFIVESAIYQLLRKYFKSDDCYGDLLELFHEVTYQTELGQLMDLITAPEDHVDLSKFSIQKHAWIVEYKTAYYSFYLPIAAAMRMAGVKEEKAYKQALDVLIPLGEYFQVQDDYLDCYGTPEQIGKIGTDIQDNKCSWLIVQALTRASPQQRKLLDDNYGKKNETNVAVVKSIYQELEIDQVFQKYEAASKKRIEALIAKVDGELLPREMLTKFLERIFK
ncbi:hypothetical protein SmJEL517_g04521 [Synchytrium microbalum]|uniref:Farnesyl pyrophosphate synthase n=1 Tax=Synchytrium microbalum TaxID=1806994 RepID=A0A507C457_9FUNG|nr:uncharacterized protein SmJEL517_g04521 [Synchytrium microbalum]TPX32355.1 hypothetical protein SmJEL517_g04521 [Synchytrium microbalum]